MPRRKLPQSSAAERHRAEIEAGLKLDIFGLGELVKRGEKAAWHGRWQEAAQAFRCGRRFAQLLLGEDHIWTATLAGKLAWALERTASPLVPSSSSSSSSSLCKADELPHQPDTTELWNEACDGCFQRRRKTHKEPSKVQRLKPLETYDPKHQRDKRKRLCLSLADLHKGVGARQGAKAVPLVVSEDNLTPRSRSVCRASKVDPSSLQERDAHSFYARGRTFAAQQELLKQYSIRRASLLEDLLQDRELVRLEEESRLRETERDTRVAREAEARKRQRLAARGGVHGLEALMRGSILQPTGSSSSASHLGARAALTAYAYEKELCCPGCRLVWDLQSRECARCKRALDFADTCDLPIVPQPVPSCFPAMQARATEGTRRPPGTLRTLRRQAKGLRKRAASERLAALPASAGWAARLSAAREARVDLFEALLGQVQAANHMEAQLHLAAPGGKPPADLMRALRKGVRAQVFEFSLATEEMGIAQILQETRAIAQD